MKKLLITEYKNKLLMALQNVPLVGSAKYEALELQDVDDKLAVGTVLIAKVQTIARNIESAFLDLGDGKVGFYSLVNNKRHLVNNGSSFAFTDRNLKSGDELLVMIEKAAVKTKDPVCTSNISITGKLAVITAAKTEISVSSKINDERYRREIKEELRLHFQNNSDDTTSPYGVIIRTEAYDDVKSALVEEVDLLRDKLNELLKTAATRTVYSVIRKSDPVYKQAINDYRLTDEDEIITDLPEVYKDLSESDIGDCSVRLYEDELLPLIKLYSIEKLVEDATSKRVWLNSGGNIVIEYTEAMTVIDVNTGKNVDKKKSELTFLMINKEAAAEIARQLRLRNLSGIIIVDFIDLKSKDMQKELEDFFRKKLKEDKVKTSLVDFTALGLAEVTRMKVKKPLHEIL